jgi:hypothetical protein
VAAGHRAATPQAPLTARGPRPVRLGEPRPPTPATARQRRADGPAVVPDPPAGKGRSAVLTTVGLMERCRELTPEELDGQPCCRDLPRIGVGALVATISALPVSVQGRWVPPLLALETVLVGGAAGIWAGPGFGLTAAVAFLVATAVLAVASEALVLVVARASPRRTWRP